MEIITALRDAIPENSTQPRVALALILAGIWVLSESDPETAEALAEVLERVGSAEH